MAASLPSQHDLIPNLGVLDRLLHKKTPKQKISAVQRETEQLPYYLRGAYAALCQLETARNNAIKEAFDIPGLSPHTQIILTSDNADPLSFSMDFYLFCMRRTFDALVPYLRRCPNKLNLPRSFSELVKGISKNSYTDFHPQIKKTVSNFWNETGSVITGYRNQANHRAIILSNCVAFKSNDGAVALKMLLPDDAHETSPSELKYTLNVHAMSFAVGALEKTVRFVNSLVEQMIDLMAGENPNSRSTGIVYTTMRGAPVQFRSNISGEPVPFKANFSNIILNAAKPPQNC